MTEQDVIAQATDQDFIAELQHPDPDPERLPELHRGSELALQAETATRLLRATLRQEASVDQLKEAMANDLAAWQAMIAKAELRSQTWRTIVRDWMLRTGTNQLRHPAFTASITKGRTKKVIPDEGAFIARCKEVGYLKAIKVIEKLVKSEADIIADTMPDKFTGLFSEETSEPGLTIRRAKE